MKQGTKDRIEGKFHELKGRAKQKAAAVASNPAQEAEGREENMAGKAQGKAGEAQNVLEKKAAQGASKK